MMTDRFFLLHSRLIQIRTICKTPRHTDLMQFVLKWGFMHSFAVPRLSLSVRLAAVYLALILPVMNIFFSFRGRVGRAVSKAERRLASRLNGSFVWHHYLSETSHLASPHCTGNKYTLLCFYVFIYFKNQQLWRLIFTSTVDLSSLFCAVKTNFISV